MENMFDNPEDLDNKIVLNLNRIKTLLNLLI
jgi:hypothetical protein